MTARFIIVVSVALILSACTSNKQLRTEFVSGNCLWGETNCKNSVLEQYLEYDLGFIEFTERGNPYDRDSIQRVLQHIDQESKSEDGAAVFVFVHGWKHNAKHNDSNVVQFREFLSRAAENNVVGERKVIGLYLGWRGAFTNVPILKEATYWTRKAVAEEVGAGGVTEIFAQLHQILVAQDRQDSTKNSYVIIGHSFGGAIVLSALHDVLLNDLIAARTSFKETAQSCKKVNRFADALILLNPAIEANKMVLLKEAAARCKFDHNQAPLMHILSSDGDIATRVFFPLGELINIGSPRDPKKLKRTINGKNIVLNERHLSLNTAGNLQQFRTAYLSFDKSALQWRMAQCKDDLSKCGIRKGSQQNNHITVSEHDPLRFIKTDTSFIKNHNDAFSCYVQSFISSTVFETQFIENSGHMLSIDDDDQACMTTGDEQFDFMQCFNSQIDNYDCANPQQLKWVP